MARSRRITSSVAYGLERKHASTWTTPGSARSTSATLGEWLPEPAFRTRSASATVCSSSGCGIGAVARAEGAPQLGWLLQWLAPGARHILHWQWQNGAGMSGLLGRLGSLSSLRRRRVRDHGLRH